MIRAHFVADLSVSTELPMAQKDFVSCAVRNMSETARVVSIALFTHPLTTFIAGIGLTLAILAWLLNSAVEPNQSAASIVNYQRMMHRPGSSEFKADSPDETAALNRFKEFLMGIGNSKFITDNTLKVYAADAFFDDTLTVHHGAATIEDYFLHTAQNMTSCEVSIDDVSRSGANYYVRWTMIFSAPALSGGSQIHSLGISQVRFDREGKVTFHHDFWDSGKNFYAHLPIASGVLGFIHKRLQPSKK